MAAKALIHEQPNGFRVSFAAGDIGAKLHAPDVQAALTEAQARWPELTFRPLRPDEELAGSVVGVGE